MDILVGLILLTGGMAMGIICVPMVFFVQKDCGQAIRRLRGMFALFLPLAVCFVFGGLELLGWVKFPGEETPSSAVLYLTGAFVILVMVALFVFSKTERSQKEE